jgi:methylmalonyl-CoA/ethylmalonyl-CoA epimerase
MAKLRHIALSVADLDQARKFFEDAFDMEMVGKAGAGVYMSDGTVNIALLAREGRPLGYEGDEPFYGIDHFGIWVDDIDAACDKVEAAGATHVLGNKSGDPNTFYEVKYRDPQGQLFDLTANGWTGAVKDVVPARETEPAE